MHTIDPHLFDQRIERLSETIFTEKDMYWLLGEPGDETRDTFLKTMSNGGEKDKEMADIFEAWLREKHVPYNRYRFRSFQIKTKEFYNALFTF